MLILIYIPKRRVWQGRLGFKNQSPA